MVAAVKIRIIYTGPKVPGVDTEIVETKEGPWKVGEELSIRPGWYVLREQTGGYGDDVWMTFTVTQDPPREPQPPGDDDGLDIESLTAR